ncbi:MAG: hypothetical protein WC249_02805 [Patescibacteria group bacterium]
MNPDEQLLNQNNSSSAEKVGALKEAQRGGAKNNNSAQPHGFKATVQAAKTEKKTKEAGIAGALPKVVTAAANKATGSFLQQCWLNIIDSFGLTLIWINIHVFLGMVLGNNLFCKLGEEWVSSLPPAFGGEGKVNKMTGLVEGMLLALLDTLALALIFFFFVLVAMLVNAVTNPISIASVALDAIKKLFSPK